jgi:hypothetical protein
MVQGVGGTGPSRFFRGHRISKSIVCLAVLVAVMFSSRHLHAQDQQLPVDDVTAKYHFLSADDTLAILDQEGRLKGYIEVTQPADESDDILSYDIVEGSRQKNHVEFRTNRIHGKYYRFSGTAERGKGHEEKESDYLHLAGSLDVVTVNAETGKESVLVMRLTFKSIGKAERPDD